MTKPQFTWRTPHRSEGALVVPPAPLPGLRERYGLEVAQVIEAFKEELEDLADIPRGQDIKRTLKQIATFAVPIPWEQLDTTVQALLNKLAADLYARPFECLTHQRALDVANEAAKASKGLGLKLPAWRQLKRVRSSAEVWFQLDRLDRVTGCWLTEAAWKLYGASCYWKLPPEALAAVAVQASKKNARSGQIPLSDVAARMLRELEKIWSCSLRDQQLQIYRDSQQRSGSRVFKAGGQDLTTEEKTYLRDARLQLFKDALDACEMANSNKNIEDLLAKVVP